VRNVEERQAILNLYNNKAGGNGSDNDKNSTNQIEEESKEGERKNLSSEEEKND